MPRVLVVLAVLGLTIYSLLDCLSTADSEVRALPKPVWPVVILLIPLLGPLTWLMAGRPLSAADGGGGATRSAKAPRPPDDDPDFLWRMARGQRRPPRPPDDEDDGGQVPR